MAVAAEAPAVSPSLDEVRALAREHNLIPLRHSFIDDCETPVSAFLKLREEGPAFLLESADQGQRVGRYSFIGFRPREVIRWSLGDDGDPYEIAAAAVAPPPRPPRSPPPPPGPATASRRSPTCRRSPAAPSVCSATTSFAPSSRCQSP